MRPALGIGFGLLVGAMGSWGLVMLPAAIADTLGYAIAERCAAAPASGCWYEVHATVLGTRIVPHYRSSDWVVTIDDQYGIHSLDVWHRSAFNELGPGENVTARYWNGRPVLIELADGGTLPTDAGPGSDLLFAGLATAMFLPFGAFYVYAAARLGLAHGWWTPPGRHVYDEMLAGAYAHIPGHRWVALTACAGGVAFLIWRLFGVDLWPAFVGGTVVILGLAVAGHLRHQHLRREPRPGG